MKISVWKADPIASFHWGVYPILKGVLQPLPPYTPEATRSKWVSLSLSLKNWRPSYPVIFLKKNRTISYQFSISMLDLSQAHLTNWHLQSAWCYGVTWEDTPKKAETCVCDLKNSALILKTLHPPKFHTNSPWRVTESQKENRKSVFQPPFFRGRSVKLRRCISIY